MVRSVLTAYQVLDMLREQPATLGELAARIGVHKTTVLRLLRTLEECQLVEREQVGSELRFKLGIGLLTFAGAVLSRLDLRGRAREDLEWLGDQSGETVHLGVLGQNRVIYIDKISSGHPVQMRSHIGQAGPLHCTALGKAMLAFVPDSDAIVDGLVLTRYTESTITSHDTLREDIALVRERQFAIDLGEEEDEIYCVAAPIFGHEARLLGAVSVAGPKHRLALARVNEIAPLVVETGERISRRMGFQAHVGTI